MFKCSQSTLVKTRLKMTLGKESKGGLTKAEEAKPKEKILIGKSSEPAKKSKHFKSSHNVDLS